MQERENSFLGTRKWIDYQALKCTHNNPAKLFCTSASCIHQGIMCSLQNCECSSKHYKCYYVSIKRVLENLSLRLRPISKEFSQSYKAVYQIFNQMIEKLSYLREKLELQQKYFGLNQQEIKLLMNIQEGSFSAVNGKLVSSLERTFDQFNDFKISSAVDIQKSFQTQQKKFNQICSTIQSWLQKNLIGQILNDSKIVKSLPEKSFIFKCFRNPSQKGTQIKANILFRASEHNFKAKAFHEKCDGKQNTLVIVKNEYGKIFGGFNPNKWQSPETQRFVKDQTGRAFMFSVNLKEKYKCIDPDSSIQCDTKWGPIFGKGCDLSISDEADKNLRSGIGFPSSYNLQQKLYVKCQQTYTDLIGNTNGYTFRVEEYEVYQIMGL